MTLKRALLAGIGTAFLTVALLGWLGYTASGLSCSLRLAKIFWPQLVTVQVEGGALTSVWHLRQLVFDVAGQPCTLASVHVDVSRLGLDWRGGLMGQVAIQVGDVRWDSRLLDQMLPLGNSEGKIIFEHGGYRGFWRTSDAVLQPTRRFLGRWQGCHGVWQARWQLGTPRGHVTLEIKRNGLQTHAVIRDSQWNEHPLAGEWNLTPQGQWRGALEAWLAGHAFAGHVQLKGSGDRAKHTVVIDLPDWRWGRLQGRAQVQVRRVGERGTLQGRWIADGAAIPMTWDAQTDAWSRRIWQVHARLPTHHGDVQAKARVQRLVGQGWQVQLAAFAWREGEKVLWHLSRPVRWRWDGHWHTQPLCLHGGGKLCFESPWRLRADKVSLDGVAELLRAFGWKVPDLSGMLSGSLRKDLHWQGHVRVDPWQVRFPKGASDAQGGWLDLAVRDGLAKVSASMMIGGKPLKITGDVAEDGGSAWHVQGDHLHWKQGGVFQGELSTDVRFRAGQRALQVSGWLRVHQGSLHYLPSLEVKELPVEVRVFEHAFGHELQPWRVHGQWQLLVDGVALNLGGLVGSLHGQLDLRHVGGIDPLAHGRLVLDHASLLDVPNATVRTAQISYFHAPWRSPDMQLLVTRPVEMQHGQNILGIKTRVVVGLQVMGSLADKRWQLFSLPSGLSREEILLGLLDADSDQLKENNMKLLSQLLFTTAVTRDSNPLRRPVHGIEKMLGLDDISLSMAPGAVGAVTDSSSLSPVIQIRKKLRDNITLGYSSILDQNENEFSLSWLLTKQFSIKAHTRNQSSGVSLLWSSP